MEYWAVLWGTILMGATGLMIWFKLDVTRFLPRWAVDVALTIHYYEAVLACLAIVVCTSITSSSTRMFIP